MSINVRKYVSLDVEIKLWHGMDCTTITKSANITMCGDTKFSDVMQFDKETRGVVRSVRKYANASPYVRMHFCILEYDNADPGAWFDRAHSYYYDGVLCDDSGLYLHSKYDEDHSGDIWVDFSKSFLNAVTEFGRF